MNVNNNELDSSEERRYTAQEKGKGRAVPAATPITISDTDGEMSDEIVLSGDGVANGNENGNDGMGGRVGMKRKALEVVDADDVDGYIRDGDESDGSEVEAIFDDSQYVEETDGGAQGEVGEKGGMGLPQKDDRLGSFSECLSDAWLELARLVGRPGQRTFKCPVNTPSILAMIMPCRLHSRVLKLADTLTGRD